MLLGIILFPLSMGFSLICRMWAFSIIHNRPLGRADWAFALGWKPRACVLHLACFFFRLGEWACEPIFQTPSVAPQPLCMWVRAITFLVLGVISMCQLGARSVRALSPFICLVIMMTFRFSRSFLPIISISLCFFRKYPLTIRLVFPWSGSFFFAF